MKRIYHTWEKWECYPAGFYETTPPSGISKEQARNEYAVFLRDIPRFEKALERVISEWTKSCEHYLTNETMNRIAWLGQASLCIETRIPACFRGGFNILTKDEKQVANMAALKWLNIWLESRGEEALGALSEAKSKLKVELY